MKRYIFIVEEGLVFLGDCNIHAEGNMYDVKDCSVVRVWGTTCGLGEIALNGPTPKTILDPTGTALIPHRKVLTIIPCTY